MQFQHFTFHHSRLGIELRNSYSSSADMESPLKDKGAPSDLLIIVDATASMRTYLESLRHALPQILLLSSLTGCFGRIGVVAYRDYSSEELLEWSGWYNGASNPSNNEGLLLFTRNLRVSGGGDIPEAVKTGLVKAFSVMSESTDTLILLYADAPPHTSVTEARSRFSNRPEELEALSDGASYEGHGQKFLDWVSACKTLARGKGDKGKGGAQVFCLIDSILDERDAGFFTFLSKLTNGSCICVPRRDALSISLTTVALILAWMGVVDSQGEDTVLQAQICQYKSVKSLSLVKDEDAMPANEYFDSHYRGAVSRYTERTNITTKTLGNNIVKSQRDAVDFAKRYRYDNDYKQLVVGHLKLIITNDVTTLALNPVFGSL